VKKRYFVIGLIVILLLVAAGVLVYYLRQGNKEEQQYKEQLALYQSVKPTDTEAVDYLAEARKINGDIVAWLTIPDTDIDFPILQTEDNDYYLEHGFDGTYSALGIPFLDYRCNGDFSDFNSIIYGHHASRGWMFSGLVDFQQEAYFNAHEAGYLTTKDKHYQLNFIACLNVKNDAFIYSTVFLSKKEKQVFLKQIQEYAVQQREVPDVDVKKLQLVSISTCSYEFQDARTVLVGYLEEID
jgi:sortase B